MKKVVNTTCFIQEYYPTSRNLSKKLLRFLVLSTKITILLTLLMSIPFARLVVNLFLANKTFQLLDRQKRRNSFLFIVNVCQKKIEHIQQYVIQNKLNYSQFLFSIKSDLLRLVVKSFIYKLRYFILWEVDL